MARRARMLEARFAERPEADCALLLARILARLGQYDEAREELDWVASTCPPDEPHGASSARYVDYHMLRLALKELEPRNTHGVMPSVSWDDLLVIARNNGAWAEELLELLYWRSRAAVLGQRLHEASAALQMAREEDSPMWRSDFERVGAQLTRCRGEPAAADG